MVQFSFPPMFNSEPWIFSGQLFTVADDAPFEAANISMVFDVLGEDGRLTLTASTENGKLTLLGRGIVCWHFTAAEMSSLGAGTYATALAMSNAEKTKQIKVGPLPIVEGHAR
ncbi:hypothetical protein ACVWZL_003361 [Bradyrhizobium sp. GM2.4]